ncbi:MAG: hypothetical protein IT379_37365 [Deltaproteobacteria bacterium]|nr:hypothetical protein [Deltaproteobacteria bacterium]
MTDRIDDVEAARARCIAYVDVAHRVEELRRYRDMMTLVHEIDRLRERVRSVLGTEEESWCAACERGGPYDVASILEAP